MIHNIGTQSCLKNGILRISCSSINRIKSERLFLRVFPPYMIILRSFCTYSYPVIPRIFVFSYLSLFCKLPSPVSDNIRCKHFCKVYADLKRNFQYRIKCLNSMVKSKRMVISLIYRLIDLNKSIK